MSKLTEQQKKIIMGVGIVAMLAAIISIGISIGRGSSLSLSAPLLLMVSSLLLMMIAKKA